LDGQHHHTLNADSHNLDLLRSLAVLFVVVSHLPAAMQLAEGRPYHLQALGYLGVIIFFVHTCLVLMLSLARQTASLGERHRARSFFIRRAFRIYPLSIAVVLAVAALAALSGAPLGVKTLLGNLLLIQNLTEDVSIPPALWSLPFEVQMYLVLPALFLLVSRREKSAPRWICLVWLASVLVLALLWRLGLNYKPFRFLPCFLPGVLAYSVRPSARRVSSGVLFLYVATVALLYPVAVHYFPREVELAWCVCVALGCIIPWCREFECSWLGAVGKVIARYSYGIYLVHGPVIDFAFYYLKDKSWLVQWGSFIVGTTGLCFLAYHLIEKPGIDLGKRLAGRKVTVVAHC
jgi:peptidoglycan/LPS O-acetylase OafA/YrhL